MKPQLDKDALFEAIYLTFGTAKIPLNIEVSSALDHPWVANKGELTPFAIYVTRQLGVDVLFSNMLERTKFFRQLVQWIGVVLDGQMCSTLIGGVEWTVWTDGSLTGMPYDTKETCQDLNAFWLEG